MLYLYQAMGLATLVLWIYCLFDAITTPDEAARNLPKILWVIIVLLFPLIGSLFWLVAGRPQGQAPPRVAGHAKATSPDDDEEFLRRLRERAEEQRRNAPKDKPDDKE
ncbi:PLD nuclease N-terminal domain-containing protein [Nonomuraea sp. NPDC059023]|uniref:PLD nuclease N-terminal domain-containing protein n=1 Tax=unclassified Nonomuraea TaxID=2593643 RepID=UPI00367D8D55